MTFGVELSAKPGKAVALLADGEAKANLSVTLTWRRADEAPSAAQPHGGPAAGRREPDDASR